MAWQTRLSIIGILMATAAGTPAVLAQEPPKLLPTSVTGLVTNSGVRPVADSSVVATAPIGRFMTNLRDYPPETHSALFATRSAAHALSDANLPSGRFAFRSAVEDDCAQALATLALAEAARFTGEAKLAARVSGATLGLLTLTEIDPANPVLRRPVTKIKGEPTRFAATLVVAMLTGNPSSGTLPAEAKQLGSYLLTRVKPTGEIVLGDCSPDLVATTPGMVLEALLLLNAIEPDKVRHDTTSKVVDYYVKSVKSGQSMTAKAAFLPGMVHYTTIMKNDPQLVAQTFGLADAVARTQIVRGRDPKMIGGFSLVPGQELQADAASSALVVRGLSRAAWLTRQVPDLMRFYQYRASIFTGLSFVAAHRSEVVALCRSGFAFLESGAEGTVQ